jgi:CRP-like cAMP-binding protein
MQIINTPQEQKIAALQSNSYFSNLDQELLFRLSRGTSLHQYQSGELIYWQGEPCIGLCIIRKGSAKLFKLSEKGREMVLRVLTENATFNEVPVFDGGPHVVNVAAIENSEVWVVEAELIRRLLIENPKMSEAVILNLSKNLRMMVSLIEELSFFQVTNRLARLISQLPHEQLVGPRSQRITQDQLAARLGTVREVVARSLRELERSGAISVYRRKIQVLDERLLKAWGQEPFNGSNSNAQ